MADHEPSSLDRFLWGRGQALIDPRALGGEPRASVLSGTVAALAGAAALASVAWLPGDFTPLLVVLGGGFVVTGVALVSNGRSRLVDLARGYRVPAGVTAEGSRLMHKLCGHIGYYNWQDEPRGRSLVGIRGYRTSRQVVGDELFSLLDQAAWCYNRIDGLLQERSSAVDHSLKALEPTVRAAALESMAFVINHAAWIDTFPEKAQDHKATVIAKSGELRELGDRLHRLVLAKPALAETLSPRNLMAEALDLLKLEEAARSEMPEESPYASYRTSDDA